MDEILDYTLFCTISMVKNLPFIKNLWFQIPPQNISTKEIRNLAKSVSSVYVCWYAENLIQFLESLGFSLTVIGNRSACLSPEKIMIGKGKNLRHK